MTSFQDYFNKIYFSSTHRQSINQFFNKVLPANKARFYQSTFRKFPEKLSVFMNIKSRWRQKWVCPSSCFNCISLQKHNQWIECHVLLRRSLCYCEMSNNSVVLGESVHVFKLCYLFTISVTWPYTTWNKGNWSTSIDGSGSKQLFNKRYRVLFIKLKSTINNVIGKTDLSIRFRKC